MEGIDDTLEAIDLIRKGLTLDAVAKEVDLSVERVRQIANKMNDV